MHTTDILLGGALNLHCSFLDFVRSSAHISRYPFSFYARPILQESFLTDLHEALFGRDKSEQQDLS
jgi:hypothetical protein